MKIEQSAGSPTPGWLQQCGPRLVTHWPVKFLGLTCGMTAFFAAYFQVLRHPLHPPVIMPLTTIDRWIPFQPAALPLYLSLWPYILLAPGLMLARRELVTYTITAVGLGVTGLGIFFLWPTAVPPPGVTWADNSLFAFLKATDASGNACPSLHVAFAIFTAGELGRLLRQMSAGRPALVLNWLWCAGILYSTIATRQHVALDVLAGTEIGLLVAGVHQRWLRSPAS